MRLPYLSIYLIILGCCIEWNWARGINGGFSCAACTILTGLVSQLAQVHNATVFETSQKLCHWFPTPSAVQYCQQLVKQVEPIIISGKFSRFFTPDVFCYAIGFCYLEPDSPKYCNLFPKPKSSFKLAVRKLVKPRHRRPPLPAKSHLDSLAFDICKLPVLNEICAILDRSLVRIEPAVDADGDLFSLVEAARGSHWRGRDCRDWDSQAYPGRLPLKDDLAYDSNCNGIHGVNVKTKQPYEKKLCERSQARGLIYIGDSVGAHFHFPRAWIDPLHVTRKALHNYTGPLLDELDWPYLGFVTGFTNITNSPLIEGYTDSIYLRLRKRNLCNHRDYQNLSQNGGSSFDALRYMRSLARNQTQDKPAIVFYAMFGNDVCNRFHDTVSNMTTPREFRRNLMITLDFLNAHLPEGSHVIMIGLVDASFIYPTMANRVHPLGSLHKNIQYKDMYEWFNCMEMGPCVVWMNSNETLRKFGSQRVGELSQVLKDLANEKKKYASFQLHYIENPVLNVVQEWKQKGYPLWKLLDPVDSFHPSQLGMPYLAENLWNNLFEKMPEVFGPENKNNPKIMKLFGDQGGH